jgi:hypothetical protein
VLADPLWSHPGLSVGGVAHLRVWTTTGGHLAVVTEQGMGCSVTNAAEQIRTALIELYGPGVVQLEHYPTEQRVGDGATLDQVEVIAGRPRWRRIWPVPLTNPDHDELRRWARTGGAVVLDVLTGGAW